MWATPQWLFDKLDAEYHFTVDVCATPENAKCPTYFTEEQDGLRQEWIGRVWCNPPYGRKIGKWVQKAFECAADVVVMLLPARTDTAWFHDFCMRGGTGVLPPWTVKVWKRDRKCTVSIHDSCVR